MENIVKNLVNPKKSSTFAAAFEKNRVHGGIAQLVRAHDS